MFWRCISFFENFFFIICWIILFWGFWDSQNCWVILSKILFPIKSQAASSVFSIALFEVALSEFLIECLAWPIRFWLKFLPMPFTYTFTNIFTHIFSKRIKSHNLLKIFDFSVKNNICILKRNNIKKEYWFLFFDLIVFYWFLLFVFISLEQKTKVNIIKSYVKIKIFVRL